MELKLHIELAQTVAGFKGDFYAERIYQTEGKDRKELSDLLTNDALALLKKSPSATLTYSAVISYGKSACLGRMYTLYKPVQMFAIIWPNAFTPLATDEDAWETALCRKEVRKVIKQILSLFLNQEAKAS